MASTLVQFRTDDAEKAEATRICVELGIDLPTYLRMCMARLVRENGIPFSMRLDDMTAQRGRQAMERASRIAEQTGAADMTLDEINEEIAQARKEAAA